MVRTIQKPQPIRTGQIVTIGVENKDFDWTFYRVISVNMELAFLEPCREDGVVIKNRSIRRVVVDLLDVVE